MGLPQNQRCLAGQQWQWDGVQFAVLQPFADQQGTKNNRSCVLKISSNKLRLLLPGDIEEAAEQELVSSYGSELNADILVVPHHGSRTSSTIAFINAVSPAYALFPVGYRNRYGFPKEDIVQRYQDREITTFRTDLHGALIFDSLNPPIRWREYSSNLWRNTSTE
jgi:competence protein ComEC